MVDMLSVLIHTELAMITPGTTFTTSRVLTSLVPARQTLSRVGTLSCLCTCPQIHNSCVCI
jgi:hypothetical protein